MAFGIFLNFEKLALSIIEDEISKMTNDIVNLMKTEDLLTNALTDEPKKRFLDFTNAWGIVNGESNLDSFIMGFRLDANFAYDAFISTETPFEDLLKE